ncbi:MAG: cell division protein FtsA [Hyphomicrobiaceae bacterium]
MLTGHRPASEIVTVLDLGTSKISCIIAERVFGPGEQGPQISRVLGFGQHRADGIRGGIVVDLDRAEIGVRHAVGQAEDQAGITIDDVIVAVSSGRLGSSHFSAHVSLEEGQVRLQDVSRLAVRARDYAERGGRRLIHIDRINYALDDQTDIHEPLHMLGKNLTCQYHAVTADATLLGNLESLIARCYLSVRSFVPTALASALAATTPDEQTYGVLSIDMGAGATNIALLAGGRFICTDTIAVGGANLTHDIGTILSAPLAEAERIKTLYGTMVCARSDETSFVPHLRNGKASDDSEQSGYGEEYQTTRAELSRILYPRARRQLELIGERLKCNPLVEEFAQSIVLTGGASQLTGLADLASDVLGRPVRIGEPGAVDGLSDAFWGPASSTAVGLCRAKAISAKRSPSSWGTPIVRESYLSRMEQWLRESF